MKKLLLFFLYLLIFSNLSLHAKSSAKWKCNKEKGSKAVCTKLMVFSDFKNKISYKGAVKNGVPNGKGKVILKWYDFPKDYKSPWFPYLQKEINGKVQTDIKTHSTKLIDGTILDIQGNIEYRKKSKVIKFETHYGRVFLGKFRKLDLYPIPLLISGKIIFEKGQNAKSFSGDLVLDVLKKENKFLHNYKKGIFVWRNGFIYDGHFLNFSYHGNGVLTYPNGNRFEGFFLENKILKGSLYYKSGSVYSGEFKDNILNGNCRLVDVRGFSFTGTCLNGGYNKGILKYDNGDIYDGEFLNNKKDGYGVYIFKNGAYYKGYFKKGYFHGKGSYIKKNISLNGVFRNGKFLKKKSYKKIKAKKNAYKTIIKNQNYSKKNILDSLKNNGSLVNEFNSPTGKYNPNNPFSEVSSPFGKLNPDNPFSEVSSPFGKLNPKNSFSEVSSPFGKLNPNNPFSEVSSPFGKLNPNNPFSDVSSPFGDGGASILDGIILE
jgi:hypothetical protein